MAILNNYDSDDEPEQKKVPKSAKAPSLDDAEAFPDAGFGSGTAAAAAAPKGGKSFASLASEVLPEQKEKMDLDKPIRIKVQRPPVKPRINKVREAYKNDATKKKGSFKMLHDEGMPAGVSEKHAACEMSEVGDVISSTSDFTRSWREIEKLGTDEGTNVRLFRSEFEDPSPNSDKFEKGGKYQIRVSKAISQDMFEEMCLYLMDNRLDNAVVGVCWCIREHFDLIQMWTKNQSSQATVDTFVSRLQLLLGCYECQISYQRLADVYSHKASKAKKFYLVEPVSSYGDGVAQSVDNIVQMREFSSKKEKKKNADEFTEIVNPNKEKSAPRKKEPTEVVRSEDSSVAVDNNYDLLGGQEDDASGTIGDDIQLFHKKLPDKNRKGSTKKGSRKEKKKNDSEFDALPGSSAPLIPQQVFVGAGLGAVLFVMLLSIFLSGALN